MKQVAFYEKADDELLQFAVIAAKYQGRWVLCKHKKRSTWEFPGGHREAGETIEAAAVRELYEETGAAEYRMVPVSVYSVTDQAQSGFLRRSAVLTSFLPRLRWKKLSVSRSRRITGPIRRFSHCFFNICVRLLGKR